MVWFNVALVVTFLILGPILILLLLHHLLKKQEHPNMPLGSMGWPLVGETLEFLKPHIVNSLGLFLNEHCSMYGRVFKSNLFGSPTIVSCDHELNQFILQNEEKLFIASYPKAMHDILGNLSLLITTGDLHRKLRSEVVKCINSFKSNPSYLQDIETLSMHTMSKWKDGDTIIFQKETRRLLFNLTVKQVLSLGPEDSLTSKILEHFLNFMKGFVSLPINLPGTSYSKAVKARAAIVNIVQEIIHDRREARSIKGDFMDTLLSNSEMTDEAVISLIMDILLAGYETTSTLLALIAYFLYHSPVVLHKLQMEHQSIRSGEPLTWDDYKKMNFTSYVIWEVMRCGNVVKMVHRQAIQNVVFKDYFIPAGWKVLPIFSGGHLDPLIHENPSNFKPSRWEDASMSKKVSPFGGGIRLCPGIELAKLETSLFLHHFVLNYRWKVMKGELPLAHPFVEFGGGLEIKIEKVKC